MLALAALILGLNLLAFRRDLFDAAILIPLIVAAVCGVAWAVMTAITAVETIQRSRGLRGLNTLIGSLAFLAICIVVYAMVARWDRSWDLTQEGRQQLSPQTVKVLQGLTQDVNVYCLFVDTGERQIEIAKDKTRRFLEQCRRHTSRLIIEFMDPQAQLARAQELGLVFANPTGTVELHSGTQKRRILLQMPNPRLEERDFTNALINVIQNAKPKIGFLTGHGERDSSKPAASKFKSILEQDGYEVVLALINPAEGTITGNPDVLVFNGYLQPETRGDFLDQEIAALDQFIAKGGRMLVLIDPILAVGASEKLIQWLDTRFGIEVGSDMILYTVPNVRPGEIFLLPDTEAVAYFAEQKVPDVDWAGCFDPQHPITRGFVPRMYLLAARSVTLKDQRPSNVVGSAVLRTLPFAYAETDLYGMYAQGKRPSRDPNEKAGSIGIAVAATMKTDTPVADTGQTRDARIVVVGDSDLTQNQAIVDAGNLNFTMNAIAWLTEREELIAIRPKAQKDVPIKLLPAAEQAIAWVSVLGVFQVVAIAGAIVFYLRRNYR